MHRGCTFSKSRNRSGCLHWMGFWLPEIIPFSVLVVCITSPENLLPLLRYFAGRNLRQKTAHPFFQFNSFGAGCGCRRGWWDGARLGFGIQKNMGNQQKIPPGNQDEFTQTFLYLSAFNYPFFYFCKPCFWNLKAVSAFTSTRASSTRWLWALVWKRRKN